MQQVVNNKIAVKVDQEGQIVVINCLWLSSLGLLVPCCQCDQKKIAKCLLKLTQNEYTRKMIDFDLFPCVAVRGDQCDQNVYKSCPKMISLEI